MYEHPIRLELVFHGRTNPLDPGTVHTILLGQNKFDPGQLTQVWTPTFEPVDTIHPRGGLYQRVQKLGSKPGSVNPNIWVQFILTQKYCMNKFRVQRIILGSDPFQPKIRINWTQILELFYVWIKF